MGSGQNCDLIKDNEIRPHTASPDRKKEQEQLRPLGDQDHQQYGNKASSGGFQKWGQTGSMVGLKGTFKM